MRCIRKKSIAFTVLSVLSLLPFAASAFQITSVSPQGEVARVRQVVAKFDDAATASGDPKAPAPLTLNCSDAEAGRGTGRWTSGREWVFDFDNDLPPGVRCSLQVKPGLKSAAGAELTVQPGKGGYQFNTGGPFVQNTRPYNGSTVDEQQYFTLQLNGPATIASLQANTWCVVDGLGERVPVRLIDGAERSALLKAQGFDKAAAKDPLRYVTLACNRRLTPAAKLQLVFGRGVATPSGVANAVEKRFNFQVREPFNASFTCERENAQAGCLPIRPVTLNFNAPVPRKLAEGIRLNSAKGEVKPDFAEDANADADGTVNDVRFNPPFAESTPYTLTLPAAFKDASDRALNNAANFPMKFSTGAMPPLAKFAAAPFGVVERFAEPDGVAMMPVTLRNVEAALPIRGLNTSAAPAGQVADLQPKTDADIIAWYQKVQRYDRFQVARKQAAKDVKSPLPRVIDPQSKDWVQSRMLSLLDGQANVKTLNLPVPASADPRPFEVVGIPLAPGFHVLEISSKRLGQSLLDDKFGADRTMVVRTSTLVTNLGVHFKLGRENALAWVTTLDKGQPVAGAVVKVSDCRGQPLAEARSNAQGIAYLKGLSSEP
ncbi:MAG: alpha-2-macroglobulin, partial [Rhodoferax sp.]|nr:alpha-2-macroglobulin [Rhodoferax sp.]